MKREIIMSVDALRDEGLIITNYDDEDHDFELNDFCMNNFDLYDFDYYMEANREYISVSYEDFINWLARGKKAWNI